MHRRRPWVAIGLYIGLGGAAGAGAGCMGGASSGNAPPGNQCRSDADCPLTSSCVTGICVARTQVGGGAACKVTLACQSGLYCTPQAVCAPAGTGAAGGSCTTDAQCQPPLRCDLDGFYGTCATAGRTGPGGACQQNGDCQAALWCAPDQTCQPPSTAYPPFAGVACADDGAFRAYFEVPRPGKSPADFFRLPFPNDVRVTGGALDMSDFPRPGPTALGVDLVQLYVDTWVADFDGFSAIAAVTFRFSAAIDFDTATADSVHYIDVTPGPTLGDELGRSWAFTTGRTKYNCGNRFTVRNAVDAPLLPGHTYAVLLTTDMRSTTGAAAAPDADLAALLAATRPATDAALGHAWDAYAPLRAWLAAPGPAPPSVAAAAVFTVQDAPGHMQRLANAVAAQPAPTLSALTLCDAGVTSPCADGTPARACPAASPSFHELHGKMTVPIFQSGTAPYDTPAQGGGIADAAAGPQVVRTEAVCFALAIPKTSAMPAGGWPLVVYSHGTGGSMRSIVTDGLAQALTTAATPSAVLGFDAVEHGARRGASTKDPQDLVFNPLNPRAARDNLLQGAADILQALRVARVPIGAGASPTGAAIAFDTSAVTFFGHSQGSTSGEIALAFSDAAPAAVLSGAGAFLTASLLDKKSPNDIAAGLAFLLGEPLDGSHPVMTLFQSFFDRSDPLNFNPLITTRPPAGVASKNVFMSWGTKDTYTPMSTLDANARSLHIPPAASPVAEYLAAAINRPVSLDMTGGDGQPRTAAVFEYATGAYDGHFVALQNPAAIVDWTAFLQSYLTTGTPTVP
jgi:hypothetical protein